MVCCKLLQSIAFIGLRVKQSQYHAWVLSDALAVPLYCLLLMGNLAHNVSFLRSMIALVHFALILCDAFDYSLAAFMNAGTMDGN